MHLLRLGTPRQKEQRPELLGDGDTVVNQIVYPTVLLSLDPWMGDFEWSSARFGAVSRAVDVAAHCDRLACTSFSLLRVPRVGPGVAGWTGTGRWGQAARGWAVGVANDVVPQGFPSVLPGPVGGQVQHRFAGRGGEAGRHVDQVAAQGGTAGHGVVAAGEDAGRAQQVVRDHRAGQPGAVGGEQPGRDVRQRAVDQIGEGGLDDGVAAVGEVGLGGGQGRSW